MNKDVIEAYNSDNILDSISPIEAKKIETKMLLASKIDNAVKVRGWKNKDLLTAIGKENPSMATKWLSGTHNFTVDTLVELEEALGISLIDLNEKRELNTARFHTRASVVVVDALRLDIGSLLNPVYSGVRSSLQGKYHYRIKSTEDLLKV